MGAPERHVRASVRPGGRGAAVRTQRNSQIDRSVTTTGRTVRRQPTRRSAVTRAAATHWLTTLCDGKLKRIGLFTGSSSCLHAQLVAVSLEPESSGDAGAGLQPSELGDAAAQFDPCRARLMAPLGSRARKVPLPWRLTSNPRRTSRPTAALMVAREMPRLLTSSASGGCGHRSGTVGVPAGPLVPSRPVLTRASGAAGAASPDRPGPVMPPFPVTPSCQGTATSSALRRMNSSC